MQFYRPEPVAGQSPLEQTVFFRYGGAMANADLTPFLDTRQNQLSLEVSAGDAIDAKALGLLAANIAILIFVAQSALNTHIWSLLIVVLFLLSSVFNIVAIWPRKYSGASVSVFDHPEYLTMTSAELVKQLIADTEAAIGHNKGLNRLRMQCCAVSLLVTICASLLLLILLYLH
jgi:hypothetical protein